MQNRVKFGSAFRIFGPEKPSSVLICPYVFKKGYSSVLFYLSINEEALMKPKKTKDKSVTIRIPEEIVDKIDWICETNTNLGKVMTRSDWIKAAINKKLRNDCG